GPRYDPSLPREPSEAYRAAACVRRSIWSSSFARRTRGNAKVSIRKNNAESSHAARGLSGAPAAVAPWPPIQPKLLRQRHSWAGSLQTKPFSRRGRDRRSAFAASTCKVRHLGLRQQAPFRLLDADEADRHGDDRHRPPAFFLD